jgi:hypothetical protein
MQQQEWTRTDQPLTSRLGDETYLLDPDNLVAQDLVITQLRNAA